MSDSTGAIELRLLADELGALAAAVDGVERVQARPGLGRLAKRVLGSLGSVGSVGSGRSGLGSGAGAQDAGGAAAPDVAITVTEASTLVELDVVVDADGSAPAIARAVASALVARLAVTSLPVASVDVRVVGVA